MAHLHDRDQRGLHQQGAGALQLVCSLCWALDGKHREDEHVVVPLERDAPPQEALGLPGADVWPTCMRETNEDTISVRTARCTTCAEVRMANSEKTYM
jgi:hypothetical protein